MPKALGVSFICLCIKIIFLFSVDPVGEARLQRNQFQWGEVKFQNLGEQKIGQGG